MAEVTLIQVERNSLSTFMDEVCIPFRHSDVVVTGYYCFPSRVEQISLSCIEMNALLKIFKNDHGQGIDRHPRGVDFLKSCPPDSEGNNRYQACDGILSSIGFIQRETVSVQPSPYDLFSTTPQARQARYGMTVDLNRIKKISIGVRPTDEFIVDEQTGRSIVQNEVFKALREMRVEAQLLIPVVPLYA